MKQNRRSSVFIRQQEDSVDGLLNDRRVKTDDSGQAIAMATMLAQVCPEVKLVWTLSRMGKRLR